MRIERKTGLHPGGMTLIEVLLAVVILSISSGVLLTAASRGLAVIRKARHYETARRLIHQVELEHPLDEEDLFDSEMAGDFPEPAEWRWERRIMAVDPELRPGLFESRIRVYWAARGRMVYEEAVCRVWRPEQEEL